MQFYDEGQVDKSILIEYLSLVIRNSTKYKILTDDLQQYSEHFLRMLSEEWESNDRVYILKIIYDFIVKVSNAIFLFDSEFNI